MYRRKIFVKPEICVVLDYLPYGSPRRNIRGPIVQALGKESLRLIEFRPKRDIFLKPHDEVDLNDKEKVERILDYINYEDLSEVSKTELPYILEKIVEENERKFVDFFNNAGPITTRLHQLELLPGIGKRLMWKIIEERETKRFESFEDIKNRIPQIGDVKKMIIDRIIEELRGTERHRVFVR